MSQESFNAAIGSTDRKPSTKGPFLEVALEPGGQASLALNIMSLDGLVGAKTFAALS